MNLRQIKATVEAKMRDEAPGLYASLKARAELEPTLLRMADEIEEAVVDATVRAGNDPKVKNLGTERLQAMDAAGREMRESLLAGLEFPADEPTTTDSAPTT